MVQGVTCIPPCFQNQQTNPFTHHYCKIPRLYPERPSALLPTVLPNPDSHIDQERPRQPLTTSASSKATAVTGPPKSAGWMDGNVGYFYSANNKVARYEVTTSLVRTSLENPQKCNKNVHDIPSTRQLTKGRP